MTEQITVNRNTLYLTIDNVRIETEAGIEKQENQFVAFIKDSAPNEVNLGEQVKDEQGENIIFNTRERAREYVTNSLKRIVYPPDFLHPLHYKKENLSELMHKPLVYDLGKTKNDEVEETIEGIMTECSLAANPPHLPGTATIRTNGGETKNLTFFEIKGIRRN